MRKYKYINFSVWLRSGGEGDDRGCDGWMASPTQWKWVWVNSRSWWWTGRPGMLRFMGSQRVRHYWETELNWMSLKSSGKGKICTAYRERTCVIYKEVMTKVTVNFSSETIKVENQIIMSDRCVISQVLSCHNKNLKQWASITALGWTSVTAPCYTSVLFRK